MRKQLTAMLVVAGMVLVTLFLASPARGAGPAPTLYRLHIISPTCVQSEAWVVHTHPAIIKAMVDYFAGRLTPRAFRQTIVKLDPDFEEGVADVIRSCPPGEAV